MDAGGSPSLADYFAGPVITCESAHHNPNAEPDPSIVAAAGYLGVLQYSPATWATVARLTGFYDWTDPYAQGYNAAVWSRLTDPAAQWGCF